MHYDSETSEYTPGQIMRYHALRIYYANHHLCQIMTVDQLDFLQDSINTVFQGIYLGPDADILYMNQDPTHYKEAIKSLQRTRRTIQAMPPDSPMTATASSLVTECLLRCKKILDIITDHPELQVLNN